MLINKILPYLKIRMVLLFMLPAVTAASAIAQQTDSLSEFLKEAALHNIGLKAKYSIYLAAMEKVPQAGTLPDPEAQFGFFIKPMELMEGNQLADFRIMQMMPWFGTLKASKDEASKMALARFEEMQSVKNELFFQVENSWYSLFRTKREIELTEKNLTILQSLERLAIVRFRASSNSSSGGSAGMNTSGSNERKGNDSRMAGGMGSDVSAPASESGNMQGSREPAMANSSQSGMVGLLRVQIEIGTLENRLALLKDRLATEKNRFNSYLDRKADTEVYISDSIQESTLPGELSLLAENIINNPMIRMFDADRDANEAKIQMVTRMGYPMIGIGLNYSLIKKFPDVTSDMNGKDMVMPMVTATLPVYRKKYLAMRREAVYLRDASVESAKNLQNELSVQFQEAIRQYNDAGRRLNLYRQQASLAGKTIGLLTASFSTDGTDFEEILRMQQQQLDYQFNQIEALVDKNLAIARLKSIIAYN